MVRARVCGGHAEFLDGIKRGAQSTRKGKAFQLVVVINAVERNVGLVAAGPIDGATPAILIQVHHAAISYCDNAGL